MNINWVEMTKLRGVVEHITYQNPENGWSVMKVKVKDYKDLVTLTGSLVDGTVGGGVGVGGGGGGGGGGRSLGFLSFSL